MNFRVRVLFLQSSLAACSVTYQTLVPSLCHWGSHYVSHALKSHPLLFISLIVTVCFPVLPTSWMAQTRHYTRGWQLLGISINAICYTWQEIWHGDMMIKMSVQGCWGYSLWLPVESYCRAGMCCFSPLSLKPVVLMSPTCQPDDGWIAQRCTLTCIINNTVKLLRG